MCSSGVTLSKGGIKRRVRDILSQAAKGPFQEYLSVSNNVIQVIQGRLSDSSKRTVALQKPQTAHAKPLESLQHTAGQLRLFED